MISTSVSVLAARTRFALIAMAAGLTALAGLALAHEGATGVVKERMDLMEDQKDAMKLMGDMAKGKTPFDTAKAAEAARVIETTSAKIPELFPEGTTGHPSEAKKEIWQNWEDFTSKADDLARAASELESAIDKAAGDEWKAGFQNVSEACKACHKSYRLEKKTH